MTGRQRVYKVSPMWDALCHEHRPVEAEADVNFVLARGAVPLRTHRAIAEANLFERDRVGRKGGVAVWRRGDEGATRTFVI